MKVTVFAATVPKRTQFACKAEHPMFGFSLRFAFSEAKVPLWLLGSGQQRPVVMYRYTGQMFWLYSVFCRTNSSK